MDDKSQVAKELVQAVKLGLKGNPRDVQAFVRKLANQYRTTEPDLSVQLSELLRGSSLGRSASPLRKEENVAAMPVDLDSRLELAKTEFHPVLANEPVWHATLATQLQQIV